MADDGSSLVIGEEGPFQKGVLLIKTPRRSKIRLIRDGLFAEQWLDSEVSYRLEGRGVYRVEVFYKVHLFGWRPWIFSNPIYLR